MYNIDLFISYAHIDNQPLAEARPGWVTRFHASLDTLLSMRLGKTVRIWRDDKLQGNDHFAQEIVQQFRQTAVLVSVLSPRYLKSEWCTREVVEFCEHADAMGGIFVDQKARVFKVFKSPVDDEQGLPSVMQQLLGYEFFTLEDGVPMELDDVYGEQFGQDFNRKVNKLAFEIAALLNTLPAGDAQPSTDTAGQADNVHHSVSPVSGTRQTAVAESGKSSVIGDDSASQVSEEATDSGQQTATQQRNSGMSRTVSSATVVNGSAQLVQPEQHSVYLAECSFDLKANREALDAELKRLGYRVLPDRQLPREEDAYLSAVSQMLNQCDLSIHPIGRYFGAAADGPSHQSITMLQNDMAAKLSEDRQLHRLIWIPTEAAPDQENQQRFIHTLHHDAMAQSGADLITGPLSNLQNAIHTTLQKLEQAQAGETPDADRNASDRLVYLICTEKDRKSTVPLRKLLKQQGFSVSTPAFKGAAAEVRCANEKLMASADVVILFYGAGEEPWKRSIDTEMKKMPCYRAGQPVPPSFTYLAPPHTCDKDDMLDMEEPNLINGMDGLNEAELVGMISLEPEKTVP